ncbi:MAG: hypothetical protein R3293_20455, partial [Candidatus Promineifilaceae bacterium]|nr:hypothetical protein [Candidatus Promineifilaceae bacterium]
MAHKHSVVAGSIIGLLVLIFGLILIMAQGWVWTWFESFYSLLGIQAGQSRFWSMFISTLGLAVVAVGLFLLWT